MVTHTMELIHKLVKMEQKKQLNLTEQYLLYLVPVPRRSLRKKTRAKILSMNNNRGNLELENVKTFDERIITFQLQLKDSVRLYYSLWKNLSQPSKPSLT